MEQLKLRDAPPTLCVTGVANCTPRERYQVRDARSYARAMVIFPMMVPWHCYGRRKNGPSPMLRPKIVMKKNTPPALAGNDPPEPDATDRKRLEENRAALMADAVERLQKRGAISREQHDDQIQEITQESAG